MQSKGGTFQKCGPGEPAGETCRKNTSGGEASQQQRRIRGRDPKGRPSTPTVTGEGKQTLFRQALHQRGDEGSQKKNLGIHNFVRNERNIS